MYLRAMSKRLETLVVGPYEVNCYLFWDEATQEGVIIDPGADAGAIVQAVTEYRIAPRAVLLTHGHGDHIGAVREVMNRFDLPLYASADEVPLLTSAAANLSAFMGQAMTTPKPDVTPADEQLIVLGAVQCRVLATPGHSPGGICFLDETDGVLFCGDVLFQGSIGRTDLPGASHDTLITSIQKKILILPDTVICYPGHGPRTTVGAERRTNPFLLGGYLA
jgi:hydroxyacylglutathione hydrolase